MPSFTRWAIATTHTPWQAITAKGSSGRLADLVVQLKSAGSGMAGRIRPAVADPAKAHHRSARCDEAFTLGRAQYGLTALLRRRILCSRVQPSSGTAMHPPNAFRIHSILPLLAPNGAIIRLEQVRSTCKNCGLRSSMTEGAGFQKDPTGTTLTCPACGATGLMDEMEIWHHWLEQRRRERLLALFDPEPDEPLDTEDPK
ncbi:hypothetical protein A1OC_01942 [Stenotrophomonas maltophilia Ab55555]|nr:hypothetical protein A1OC_01942 [Stenotrophomonas maltophilia Ab55555]